MLDRGSQTTFISSAVAKLLPPPEEFVELQINKLGVNSKPQLYPVHTITLCSKDGSHIKIKAVELEQIINPINTELWEEGARMFPHHDLSAYKHPEFSVEILIVSDNLHHVTLINLKINNVYF